MIILYFVAKKLFLCISFTKRTRDMKKEMILLGMIATASIASAQNAAGSSVQAADSILATWKDSIQAVTVVGHRPMFKMKDGALVTHVRNTPLAQEPRWEDILRHIPGMKQSQDGTFEVSGLGAPTIYINDKKATSAELAHIDVKQIDDIELITTPGAQYDASTGAVLRIVMKRRDVGIFGKIQAYDELSEVNTTNGDITLGYTNSKISISGFYGYQDNRYNVHQPQEATVRATDGEYLFGSDRHGKNKAYANASEINFDWLLGKHHEMGAQWEGLWLSGGRSEEQSQYYRNPGEDLKFFDAESQQWAHSRQNHFNLFHLGKWSKSLSSQLYLDYVKNAGNDSQPIHETEGSEERVTLNSSHTDYDIYSARLNMKQLLGEHHALNFGGEWSLTDGKGNTSSSSDQLGTTEYKNHDTKTAAFLQYQGSAGKWTWSAGIRYEHLTSSYTNLLNAASNMSRTYDQWFPSFSVSLNEPSWHHSLNFRTTTSRPSFSQLSGNIYYISRFDYGISNPKLQAYNTYRLTYSVQWKDFYGILRYTYIDHPIMYIMEVPEDKPVRYISTFMNYGKQQRAYAYLNWGHTFGFWRPNISLSTTYQFFKVDDQGERINYNGFSWSASIDNYFTLPHGYQLSLSYLFENRGMNGRIQFRPDQNWSIGANKSFMGDRLQVAFSASDLFHQFYFREKTHQHSVDFSQTEDYKLWNYKLTLTWKFNKRTGRYHGENSAQDELNRL